MKALGGALAALVLLAAGFIFLPALEVIPLSQSAGVFAVLWLLIAAISAFAFGREFWLLMRLNRIRSRWVQAAIKPRRRSFRSGSRATPLRERERRLY